MNTSFEARDRGIEQAVRHADAVHTNWSEQAFSQFKVFLIAQRGEFMSEDFREFASGMLPEPPSKRAFGHVMLRAAKAGLIKKVGHSPVKNIKAHRAFASVWTKA